MIWIPIAVLVYVASYVACVGITFAYFQSEWPMLADKEFKKDKQFAFWFSTLGPISLIWACVASDGCKYGWRWPK